MEVGSGEITLGIPSEGNNLHHLSSDSGLSRSQGQWGLEEQPIGTLTSHSKQSLILGGLLCAKYSSLILRWIIIPSLTNEETY